MQQAKMKTILFTIVFVVPLSYLYKYIFPETSRLGGLLVIIGLIIIFHLLGRFIFSRREKRVNK